MKNVKEHQLKKCIFIELDSFKQDVKKALGDDVVVSSDYEGIYFEANEDDISTQEVLFGLSTYYDAEVTSVHVDDCDCVGVWVCYK